MAGSISLFVEEGESDCRKMRALPSCTKTNNRGKAKRRGAEEVMSVMIMMMDSVIFGCDGHRSIGKFVDDLFQGATPWAVRKGSESADGWRKGILYDESCVQSFCRRRWRGPARPRVYPSVIEEPSHVNDYSDWDTRGLYNQGALRPRQQHGVSAFRK